MRRLEKDKEGFVYSFVFMCAIGLRHRALPLDSLEALFLEAAVFSLVKDDQSTFSRGLYMVAYFLSYLLLTFFYYPHSDSHPHHETIYTLCAAVKMKWCHQNNKFYSPSSMLAANACSSVQR